MEITITTVRSWQGGFPGMGATVDLGEEPANEAGGDFYYSRQAKHEENIARKVEQLVDRKRHPAILRPGSRCGMIVIVWDDDRSAILAVPFCRTERGADSPSRNGPRSKVFPVNIDEE
jgi:hypothetical protein